MSPEGSPIVPTAPSGPPLAETPAATPPPEAAQPPPAATPVAEAPQSSPTVEAAQPPTQPPTSEASQTAPPSQPAAETTPVAPEKKPLRTQVEQDYAGPNGAIDLVTTAAQNGEYQTGDLPKIAQDLGVTDPSDPKVQTEVQTRNEIAVAADILTTVRERLKTGQGIKNPGNGRFELTGTDGLIKVVRLQDTVVPVMEALARISTETEIPAGQSEAKPTARAIRAQEILKTLTPQLAKDPNGGHYFNTEEPAAKKEAEKPEDKLMQKAKDVARALQTQNGAVDTMSKENLDKIPENVELATLEVFLLAAEKASGAQREYLLAAIYEQLQNPGLVNQLPQESRGELNLFLQDKEIAGDRETAGIAQKGRHGFIHSVVIPLLREKFPQEYSVFTQEIDPDQMFRNFFLGIHFQGQKGISPEDIKNTLNAQRKEGLTFTAGDTALIQAVANKDNKDMVEAVLTGMGLDLKELKNLPGYGEAHAAEIVDFVATAEEKTTPEWNASQARNNRIAATKKHFDINEMEIQRKRKLIPPQLLMALGGATVLLTMFQNTLGFGVFLGQEENQGH